MHFNSIRVTEEICECIFATKKAVRLCQYQNHLHMFAEMFMSVLLYKLGLILQRNESALLFTKIK